MLDVAFIRDNLDAVVANCRNRNVQADPARVVALDDERKRLEQERSQLQQRANEVARRAGPEKDPVRKQELIAEGRTLRERVAELERVQKRVEADRDAGLSVIPNMTHPDAPVGATA